jgi:salicylate 5-hydroxylase small subunit
MAAMIDFEDWLALTQLYADYASAVDSGDWDAVARVLHRRLRLPPAAAREPRARLAAGHAGSFESKGMLKDRVYGIRETLFHDPYYQRHVVGAPGRARGVGRRFRCEANYAVFRTKLSDASTVFNVGRYLDVVVRTPAGLKFASRECIYDSEMIPNSIIYPI